MMQGMTLMAENLMGVASLLSLQEGCHVVQEVSVNMTKDLLLAAAITVGWMATGFVIAKLVTGEIDATAVEKWAIQKETARTVQRI